MVKKLDYQQKIFLALQKFFYKNRSFNLKTLSYTSPINNIDSDWLNMSITQEVRKFKPHYKLRYLVQVRFFTDSPFYEFKFGNVDREYYGINPIYSNYKYHPKGDFRYLDGIVIESRSLSDRKLRKKEKKEMKKEKDNYTKENNFRIKIDEEYFKRFKKTFTSNLEKILELY